MEKRSSDVAREEVLERLQSRGDFLKMAGAAGLGATLGANILLGDASAAVDRRGFGIDDLRFRVAADYRPFGVISKNFVQHEDDFSRQRDAYRIITPAPEDNSGDVSVRNGRLRVSDDSPLFTLFRTRKGPRAPYASVIVDIARFGGSATTEQTVYAGLIKNGRNYVVAWYNNATKHVGIDVVEDGVLTKLDAQPADLEAGVRFAFVLNGKEVTALATTGGEGGPGGTWKPLANYPNEPTTEFPDPATAPGLSAFVDLQDPQVLREYNYGFGVRADSGAVVLDGVKAGYWGRAGVRDPHVVTWKDGTPYIKNNKLYLTLTNAGLDFFATAHWGVYTLDLDNYTSPNALEEVGKIFIKRREVRDPDPDDPVGERESVGEPKIFGDNAGHIVYDGRRDRFLVGVSSWGDFIYNGVQINYTWTEKNVLRGVHVLEVKKLPLPPPLSNTALNPSYPSTWDPHFVRIRGQWFVAYVESPSQGGDDWDHHPALARGETLQDLRLVGRDEKLNQTEGTIIQKVGGKWYVLCVSGELERGGDPAHYRIYNLQMEFVGFLKAPFTGNIPHPMITPLPRNGNTKWIMLTFDGTMYYIDYLDYGTHGDFYVMNGLPIVEGYEFPPREP